VALRLNIIESETRCSVAELSPKKPNKNKEIIIDLLGSNPI
jgi:hypothetical protein